MSTKIAQECVFFRNEQKAIVYEKSESARKQGVFLDLPGAKKKDAYFVSK